MLTGCFTLTGAGHGVIGCQDYALTGNCDGVAVAVVSDGCSSAPHAELGSAMLCHAFRSRIFDQIKNTEGAATDNLTNWLIRDQDAETSGGTPIQELLIQAATRLGLQTVGACVSAYNVLTGRDDIVPGPLHATTSLLLSNGKQAMAVIYGDGSLIVHEGGDDVEVISVDFTDNVPYYLVYGQHQAALEDYNAMVGVSGRHVSRERAGPTVGDASRTNTAIASQPTILTWDDLSGIESITITSDGIGTLSRDQVPVSVVDAARLLVKFPLATDGFALRQQNIIAGRIKRKELVHMDDLTVATILFGGRRAANA